LRTLALLLLFTVLPIEAAPRPTAPDWEMVPSGVVDALCQRLKMDAIATGSLAIVRVTQPLITPQSIATLAGPKKVRKAPSVSFVNRAIPIDFTGTDCHWRPIEAGKLGQLADEMVVELSAPLANPYSKGEAGLFVRVTLGGEHPAWYWISLVPAGEGWAVRFVFVLSR
jgi:hypothetical protein